MFSAGKGGNPPSQGVPSRSPAGPGEPRTRPAAQAGRPRQGGTRCINAMQHLRLCRPGRARMYKRLAAVDNARQPWTTPVICSLMYAFVKRCSPGPAAGRQDRPGSASRQPGSPGPPAGPGRAASPHETRPGPPRTRPGPCMYSNLWLVSCSHITPYHATILQPIMQSCNHAAALL